MGLALTSCQQPLAGRYLGWILFSFFLHFTFIPLALNHLARLADAGLLAVTISILHENKSFLEFYNFR